MEKMKRKPLEELTKADKAFFYTVIFFIHAKNLPVTNSWDGKIL